MTKIFDIRVRNICTTIWQDNYVSFPSLYKAMITVLMGPRSLMLYFSDAKKIRFIVFWTTIHITNDVIRLRKR